MDAKKITVTAVTGSVAFFAGLLLASGGLRSGLLKTFALSGLLTVPTVFVAHLVIDTRATNKINQADQKATDATKALLQAKSQVKELERVNTELCAELAKVREALESTEGDRAKLAGIIATLDPVAAKLEAEVKASQERIAELELEIEAWEFEFANRVASEAENRFKEARAVEIQKIFEEHDAVTREAMQLFRELQGWGQRVAHGHSTKREIIVNLATQYNRNLDEINGSVEKERASYLEQIELLNEKVARLQHELNGDLIEPIYAQFGFSPEGRIANALAEWLWHHRQIPLKVTGVEVNSDGSITAGYSYPRSMPVEALIKAIEKDSPLIARNLGLYALQKPEKLQITDCLAVKIRRERPTRKTDKGSLYRSKEEFVKFILGQPTRLRVIGEPGAGKTPTVAVLLSHILKRGFLSANTPNGQKLPYCVVESCNPLAGISVKNGDELDFCLCWDEGKKGFKGLAQEYKFRKNPANANYKNSVGYIWVADEIDNSLAEMTKDEAKPFKDALKDGGHVNIGVIVMGQSANVSTSKGLSIDDQKMMTNIYIDPVSIRTFLTQYGERFYSKKAVEKALATLEELELEIEEQNEIICDTAREFRIAMVTANRSPVFYQLPYFDSVQIDVDEYQQTLAKVSVIRSGQGETPQDASVSPDSQSLDTASFLQRLYESGRSRIVDSETGRDTSAKPICPHCGSDRIRSKGNSWLCQNPEHSNVAPDKPKSWKK